MIKLKHLKFIRRTIAVLIIISILTLFLNIGNTYLKNTGDFFVGLQIFPSIINLSVVFVSASLIGLIAILLLTLFFGRVYCSSICPMGTLQDFFSFFSSKLKSKKRKRFHYSSQRKRILKYSVLFLTIMFWIFGSLFLINALDPYSNFGKITTTFVQPAYIYLNNILTVFLEGFNIYYIEPMEEKTLPLYVVLTSLIILLAIAFLSIWRGRLFCNTLCPAGALLSILGERALFKINIKQSECTFCGKCEWVCKSECIDSKNSFIDHGRCVSCFNCFASCTNNGFHYVFDNPFKKKKIPKEESDISSNLDSQKRSFLLTLGAGLLSFPVLNRKYANAEQNSKPGMVPTGSELPVTPPGSQSIEHFTNNCIACYLCVSKCPKNVIVPSFFDYGLQGFMQPKLDFNKSFCNYDCIDCTQVCPTGAILPQTIEKKKTIQLGVARFYVESCIVMIDKTDCGACSEHCPTKAVNMVPFEGLWLPEVNPEICIGCGACEYACPTSPYKAIYVESNAVHKKALAIADDEGPKESEDEGEEFPF
ncbi:MAG: 4Fe-4S dicluster domain-containing protein [Bacteroidota bacterium]